mmetsp:Transcript_10438/g.28865  ORF Transcript_10438/g.28865 Transcript_10438/m.28865 type:complete len:112 (-) Transcript_10438:86-421(-)
MVKYGRAKIVLRMTCGPTNACINFHCDGAYASHTVQIAVNDSSDDEGGRLCFFVNDTLCVLERSAGSMVQRHPSILHGVTALIDGTRNSLFVVDEAMALVNAALYLQKRNR